MSHTNPPSGASGPGSVSGARTQTIKRSVQAAFEDPADRGVGPAAVTGYQSKTRVTDRYRVIGFISSGTYGRVYKAVSRQGQAGDFAIKKFKPDKEGEQVAYTGISQSAIREMALCSELSHDNVIRLVQIILEDKCIYMVFEYAEHDLLQIIHHHTQQPRHPIPPPRSRASCSSCSTAASTCTPTGSCTATSSRPTSWSRRPARSRSATSAWPACSRSPCSRSSPATRSSSPSGTAPPSCCWARAHYTPAIDMWAVGCIFAELLSLRPIFKGEEAKMDSKKTVPFQRNQMQKIVDIMGLPTKDRWPLLVSMPEHGQLNTLQSPIRAGHRLPPRSPPQPAPPAAPPPGRRLAGPVKKRSNLEKWYYNTINQAQTSAPVQQQQQQQQQQAGSGSSQASLASLGHEGFKLLAACSSTTRPSASRPKRPCSIPSSPPATASARTAFEGLKMEYPHRRVSQDDNDIRTSSLPGTKRSGLPR